MLLLVLAFPLDMSPNLWSLVQRYFVLWRRLTDRSIVDDDWTATNGEQINHSHTGICLSGLAVQSDVRRVSVTVVVCLDNDPEVEENHRILLCPTFS